MGSQSIKAIETLKGENIPPQNIEAESSVLGSMLIESDAIGKALEIINEQHFYKEVNRKIFLAIISLFERNEAVDLITVTEELKKQGELELVGGASYIEELIDRVPTAANVEHYANIVREKAILRKLITVSSQIASYAYKGEQEVNEILDSAEQLIFNISQHRLGKGFTSIKSHIHGTIDQIEKVYHKKAKVTGVATWLEAIDSFTAGFQPSDMIVVAARPGMGKTSLCLTIAQNVAIHEHGGVAIFSLEMPTGQVVQRMLCSEARVDLHRVRSGRLFDSDWPKLTIAAGLLAEAPIYIDDSAPLTILDIRAKIRRLQTELKGKLKLIMVDYLQMMQGRARAENRQQEIAEISRSLKALAKELAIPIVVVSQLSRAPEQRHREDPRPQLSDLRESGAIEQDADLVAFVFRESYYKRDSDKQGESEIIIAKHRNGPLGTIKLAFLKEFARFENLAIRPETT